MFIVVIVVVVIDAIVIGLAHVDYRLFETFLTPRSTSFPLLINTSIIPFIAAVSVTAIRSEFRALNKHPHPHAEGLFITATPLIFHVLDIQRRAQDIVTSLI